MTRVGEHAVVIGGSVGGMLAARVLADAYERVTVIDRDELPVGGEQRRAVPQGRHGHALLPKGLDTLEALLPGIGDELVEDGAATTGALSDTRFILAGHELPRVAFGVTGIAASRPFIEGHVRRRVRALGNVELRERSDVVGLAATPDRERVIGVQVNDGDGRRALAADLVMASSGRSARVPGWLEELGFERPEESALEIDLGYASRNYRLPPEAIADSLILIGPRPGRPRGLALFAQEGGASLLTLAGYGEHKPPVEDAAFADFLETVAPPDVLAAVREAEPLDEIVSFGTPANRRRHYERMGRFPDGLLLIGDAICNFNPVYGQGMTVAALEAAELRRCLERGERDLRRRYFRAAARVVDPAWQLAVGGDLALPEVKGARPLPVRLTNAYIERLRETAERDAEVSATFMRVAGMLDRPSSLIRPAIVRRVLARRKPDSLLWPGKPLARPVRRRTLRAGGIATRVREAGPAEASEAVVFVHGVPGSGADFEPLLAAAGRLGRAVAWDAPGFGKADKPQSFDQSVEGHAEFIDRALEELGIERAHLVLHDFGGPWGLRWAIDQPERLAGATLICTGPVAPDRWHRAARIWRTRLAGEMLMATATRAGFGASMRQGQTRRLPGPFLDRMFADFDRDTRAAILRLYRSVGDLEEATREAVAALRPLELPALVIWGENDPYLPADLAERQLEAFPGAEVHVLERSGHWPFVDRAERVEELLLDFIEPSLAGAEEPAQRA